VVFAGALTKILNTPGPDDGNPETVKVDTGKIRSVIDSSPYGYLDPIPTARLLDASGIKRVREEYACSLTELTEITDSTGFPVVMKIAGPLHKTDVGGVVLNIGDPGTAVKEYTRMSQIPGFKGVIIQEMVSGLELFAGVKNEGPFGHILMAGMGGVLVEVMKDFSAELIPVSAKSAIRMIHSLKGYDIIKGVSGRKGVNESLFVDIICRLSALIEAAPEIMEVDLNPLIGSGDMIIAVDARIRIEKTK
jgi:acyl-CoA synthetase (NDP forming)